jgi:hypothetical protein
LRLAELSQSKSGCGNRCAKAKPPLCSAGTSRDIVNASRGVNYCDDIWHQTASVSTVELVDGIVVEVQYESCFRTVTLRMA